MRRRRTLPSPTLRQLSHPRTSEAVSLTGPLQVLLSLSLTHTRPRARRAVAAKSSPPHPLRAASAHRTHSLAASDITLQHVITSDCQVARTAHKAVPVASVNALASSAHKLCLGRCWTSPVEAQKLCDGPGAA